MGFSILLDLAILCSLALCAFLATSRSRRLGCAVALFALTSLDLMAQVSASAMERMMVEAAYPLLYPAMLFKNCALFALAIYGVVRVIELPHSMTVPRSTRSLAHRAL